MRSALRQGGIITGRICSTVYTERDEAHLPPHKRKSQTYRSLSPILLPETQEATRENEPHTALTNNGDNRTGILPYPKNGAIAARLITHWDF